MNYLAHGYRHTEKPYRLAGTAVPDWLSACDRRWKVRRAHLDDISDGLDADDYDLREGIRRHFQDDDWFHNHETFVKVVTHLTGFIRAAYPEKKSLRASFLAHLITELLLDSHLMETDPQALERYYSALARVDAHRVERLVSRIMETQVRLAPFIEMFRQQRFLTAYLQDRSFFYRLSQVVHRVGLPALPVGFEDILPTARQLVRQHAGNMLPKGPPKK